MVSVGACRQTPQSKIQNECCIVFATIADRDTFRAYAPKLQPYRQREAGIRLALPDHLLSTFKLLEHEGFKIVNRCPGTKRSIKYEDRSRSLVLDVKLPGAERVRISPEQVVAASRGRKKNRVPAVSEILRMANEDMPVTSPALADGEDESMGDDNQQ